MERLEWQFRPYSQSPEKAWVVWGSAVAAAVVGTIFLHQLSLGMFGFAMVLANTAEYWLATHYSLDCEVAKSKLGVAVSEIRWENVRRVEFGSVILLSPLEKSGRMDAFRGIRLRIGEDRRDELETYIEAHCPQGTRYVGRRPHGGGGGKSPAPGSNGNPKKEDGDTVNLVSRDA